MPFSWAAASASASAAAISRTRSFGDQLVERLALDQLHREEVDPVRLFHGVDGHDRRVVEGGERLRLAPEALQPLGAPGHLARQHLEGYVTAELGIPRPVDLAHSAGAERGGDAVVGQGPADQGSGSSCRVPRRLPRGITVGWAVEFWSRPSRQVERNLRGPATGRAAQRMGDAGRRPGRLGRSLAGGEPRGRDWRKLLSIIA